MSTKRTYKVELKQLGRIVKGLLTFLTPWKKTAFVYNVAPKERTIIRKLLTGYNVYFLKKSKSIFEYSSLISSSYKPNIFVWGQVTILEIKKFSEQYKIPVISIGHGPICFFSNNIHKPKLSSIQFCLSKDNYRKDSPLDMILEQYDLTSNQRLLRQAKSNIHLLTSLKISKFRIKSEGLIDKIEYKNFSKRILILEQETQHLNLPTSSKIKTMNDLVKYALENNPDAIIFYKLHPRLSISRGESLESFKRVKIISSCVSLPDCLLETDKVYTFDSWGGLEALLYGVPVSTFANAFYAGWGLTEDHQLNQERNKRLSLEELFAAAYMLNCRYVNPTKSDKTLISLNEYIKLFETTNDWQIPQDNEVLNYKFSNFVTSDSFGFDELVKLSDKKIGILTNTASALNLMDTLCLNSNVITVLTTTDALANSDIFYGYQHNNNKITVDVLTRKFGKSAPEIENDAVDMGDIIVSNFVKSLNSINKDILDNKVIRELGTSLNDQLFSDLLKLTTLKLVLEKFDILFFHLHGEDLTFYLNCLHYYKSTNNSFSNVYIVLDQNSQFEPNFKSSVDSLSFIDFRQYHKAVSAVASSKLLAPYFNDMSTNTHQGIFHQIKKTWLDFWHNLENTGFNDFDFLDNYIVACGNFITENYGYAPVTLELLSILKENSNPVIYFNSNLLNSSAQEKMKQMLVNSNNLGKFYIYDGCGEVYKQRYSPEQILQSKVVGQLLMNLTLTNMKLVLPESLAVIVFKRIQSYFKGVLPNLLFYIYEAELISKKCNSFVTSMDRVYFSRILSSVLKSRGVPTYSVQPQLISTSRRYLYPAVDFVGVADSSQTKIFQTLGARKEAIFRIGSVNISNRLNWLELNKSRQRISNAPVIFFPMQHSFGDIMYDISESLIKIARKIGLRLIIKPHPAQEQVVMSRINNLIIEEDDIVLLSRESDTYNYLAKSDIVVGFFSSVLYEAAISGMDVVIVAYKPIEHSMDYSELGLALKVIDHDELEKCIVDLVKGGSLSKSLELSRGDYLKQNPQFERPYDNRAFREFIGRVCNTGKEEIYEE